MSKLEAAVIDLASRYAKVNGLPHQPGVGQFLVGFAIACAASPEVRDEMLAAYLRDLPEAEAPVRSWASTLDAVQR